MVIQLSPRLEEKIAALVASGHRSDADEVVEAAIQLLEDQELKTNPADMLQVGFDQDERGELIEYTPAFMDHPAEESEARFLAGEMPSRDVPRHLKCRAEHEEVLPGLVMMRRCFRGSRAF